MRYVLLTSLLLVSWVTGARAQVPDHLKCYKVKDTAVKFSYTADLLGLAPEAGCRISVPAKMLCAQTPKTNVAPTPPGAPGGPAAGNFACYKVKCPKGALAPVTFTDQFGSRQMLPSAPKLLCAPGQLVGGGSTTTTTTATTSSSTTTTSLPPIACCDFGAGLAPARGHRRQPVYRRKERRWSASATDSRAPARLARSPATAAPSPVATASAVRV